MRRILAIGHDASLTGAPTLLLSFVEWLVQNRRASVCTLLGTTGPLVTEFAKACPTKSLSSVEHRSVVTKALGKVGVGSVLSVSRMRGWLAHVVRPEVIYVNSIASIPVLHQVERTLGRSVPTVIHIHELRSLIREYERLHSARKSLEKAAVILAASEAVKNDLKSELGLAGSRVRVVREWLCKPPLLNADRQDARAALRQQLGIASNSRISLSMGAFGWRKGQEFIPLIAKLVKERGENLHFLWVGDDGICRQAQQLSIDAERLGVADRVHFRGPVADPRRFFLASDFFSLVSREDPYPLVMLEAASHGLPVVCFDSSGGAPEFVSNERGMVVPYLDCQRFADALVLLCRDSVRAAALAENGRRYAIDSHSLEPAMELILSEIEAAC